MSINIQQTKFFEDLLTSRNFTDIDVNKSSNDSEKKSFKNLLKSMSIKDKNVNKFSNEFADF